MSGFLELAGRRAGIIAPLSALRTRRDAGVGDIGALDSFFDWMSEAGLSVVSLLPLNDLAPLDSCPYSAISAFALDPAYADLDDIPDLRRSPEGRRRVDETLSSTEAELCRRSPRAHFGDSRALKLRLLEEAFRRFEEAEWDRDTPRARELQSFVARNRWLADYALFKAVKEARGWESWLHWPAGLKDRDPRILAQFRSKHSARVRFHEYAQWLLHAQWQAARKKAAARGILLYGDLPFGLSRESADIWSRREDFDTALTMGAPPDWFSATGQDWSLPAYRWGAMEEKGQRFWRERVRRAAESFDLFRLDHAVGFFRTWVLDKDPRLGRFDIEGTDAQRARGERFFRITLEEAGRSRPVAEDLGVIPPFMREVLGSLGIPGYKVARWERFEDERRFRPPREYPALSVAVAGTHDTSPLAAWWEESQDDERGHYWEMAGGGSAPPKAYAAARERILSSLYSSGSALALLQFQDVAGTRERVNMPGTVGEHNWTYRIPLPAEDLCADPAIGEATRLLKRLSADSGRLPQEPR